VVSRVINGIEVTLVGELETEVLLAEREEKRAAERKAGVFRHPGGQFAKGNAWAFSADRPPIGRLGTRDKVSRDFLTALTKDFEVHGAAAIRKMRVKRPADYCKVIASLLPKQIEVREEPFDGVSDTELAAIIATARGSLVAIEGGRGRSETEDGDQPPPELPAVP
jgi:hypothetical protein